MREAKTSATTGKAIVRMRGLSKSFGDNVAFHPHDLDIQEGEFLALLGPSGCGKTTLLKMIGGFLAPTTGTIEISGEDVTRYGPEKRRTNLVFQGYGLFPHMTVRQNVAYGLKLAQTPKKQMDEKTDRMLSLVHLDGYENRMPQALSGGQAQRVALARALVMEPTVLLMDECLSALDLQLRKEMQDELRTIHAALGGTYVFVTHDQNEAMSLATRIAVMKDGNIVQQGSAKDIYENPASRFVAGFVGEANMIKGRRAGGQIHAPDLQCAVTSDGVDCDITIVIRPDVIEFANPELQYDFAMLGTVQSKTYFGSHLSYDVDLDHGRTIKLTQTLSPADSTPEVGQQLRIGWNADRCKILEAE